MQRITFTEVTKAAVQQAMSSPRQVRNTKHSCLVCLGTVALLGLQSLQLVHG